MERNDLLNPAPSTLRASLLILLALGAAGCSSIDCDDPTRYIGAELHAPLANPPGLDAVVTRDAFKVPGGAPPKEYQGGACLLKPPQLVKTPDEETHESGAAARAAAQRKLDEENAEEPWFDED